MKLFSRVLGEGEPLIILHGLFGMSDNWNTLAKRFSKNYSVHLLDLRNHGKSPHSDNFNYDVMSIDVVNYINDNKISMPIILGHSMGGKVAMALAFKAKIKIKKILVADISPRNYSSDFHFNILKILYRLPLDSFRNRGDVDNSLSKSIEDKRIRFFLLKNLYRNEKNEFSWRFNIGGLLDKIRNIEVADFIIGKCATQAHFIRGEKSKYIKSDDEEIIKNHFSYYSISTIEGAGHWLHAEQPELFYREVIRLCNL